MKFKVEVDFLCGNKFVDTVMLDDKQLKKVLRAFDKKKNFFLEGTKNTVLVSSEYVTNLQLQTIKENEE